MAAANAPHLMCVLDESQGRHCFTITGVITSIQNWERLFEPSWKAALEAAKLYDIVDSQGVPILHPFHMTDFESRFKPFDRFTNEKRIELQSGLIDILNRTRLFVVSAQLPLSVFDAVCKSEGFRDEYKLKYLPCFVELYTNLYKMVGERIRNAAGKVTMIADHNQQVSGMLLEVHRHVRKLFPETTKVFDELTFESKTECIRLQAADLFTYEFTKAADCDVMGQPCSRISYQRLDKNAEIIRFTEPSFRATVRNLSKGGTMKELKQAIRSASSA